MLPINHTLSAIWRVAFEPRVIRNYSNFAIASFCLTIASFLATSIGIPRIVCDTIAWIGLVGCGLPIVVSSRLASEISASHHLLNWSPDTVYAVVLLTTLTPYFLWLFVGFVRLLLARCPNQALTTGAVLNFSMIACLWIFYATWS